MEVEDEDEGEASSSEGEGEGGEGGGGGRTGSEGEGGSKGGTSESSGAGSEPEVDDDAPCVVCQGTEGGRRNKMLFCDTEDCNKCYHQQCLQPPLLAIPRGKWFCPECK